jgi:drug/metabolite transporter (DMT)-like permease
MIVDGLWIPVTIGAAFFQAVRTALQKYLKAHLLSTNGSSFTRFFYGFPLALLYVFGLHHVAGLAWPTPHLEFFLWTVAGGITQIIATSLLIYVFGFRNFPVGIAYSKTEVMQAAVFGLVFLGDRVTLWGVAAIMVSTVGVMLISLVKSDKPWRAFLTGWIEKPALIGMASGAFFAVAAIAFRGAALSLGHDNVAMSAGYSLAWGTAIQTMMLGVYLYWREPEQIGRVLRAWRVASLVGVSSALGSICWFTAMTIQVVAYVRTLGLIELIFTFLISTLAFRERPALTEVGGILLVVVGIAMVLNLR